MGSSVFGDPLTIQRECEAKMPVSYRIDQDNGMIRTRCVGNVTFEEVVDHFRDLEEDPTARIAGRPVGSHPDNVSTVDRTGPVR